MQAASSSFDKPSNQPICPVCNSRLMGFNPGAGRHLVECFGSTAVSASCGSYLLMEPDDKGWRQLLVLVGPRHLKVWRK